LAEALASGATAVARNAAPSAAARGVLLLAITLIPSLNGYALPEKLSD
jgi:hypothetical protein